MDLKEIASHHLQRIEKAFEDFDFPRAAKIVQSMQEHYNEVQNITDLTPLQVLFDSSTAHKFEMVGLEVVGDLRRLQRGDVLDIYGIRMPGLIKIEKTLAKYGIYLDGAPISRARADFHRERNQKGRLRLEIQAAEKQRKKAGLAKSVEL